VLRHGSLLYDINEGRMRRRLHKVGKNAPVEQPEERKVCGTQKNG